MNRKSNNNKRKGKASPKTSRGMHTVTVPRSVGSPFPDRYICTMKTVYIWANTATPGISFQFKVTDPLNLAGPRLNYAGAFGINVPSGLKILVGSDVAAGANVIYNRALVTKCTAVATCYSQTGNTAPLSICLGYNRGVDVTAGMSISQIPEQPFTVTQTLPPILTGVQKPLVNTIDTCKVLGVSPQYMRDASQVYGTAIGLPPTEIVYVTVTTRTLDASNSAWEGTLTLFSTIEFTSRNALSTDVPV